MKNSGLPGKTLLILGHVFPEPHSSAAGVRMLQLIQFFLQKQMKVVFACDSLAGPYSVLPEHSLLSIRSIEVNNSSFDQFLLECKPDLVLFDRFMTEEKYGWRVTEILPGALQILDMEDFHALRKARELAKGICIKPDISDFQQDFAWREIASVNRCDLVLVISDFEMTLLKDYFHIPEFALILLPFWADSPDVHAEFPGWQQRKHFVSIGNFLHPPNVDSVKWLRNEIWPAIRNRLPDAQLHVYGAYQNDKQSEWHDPESGFFMQGRAEDAFNVLLKARVSLAPLRFGAGLKGKLLMSMLAKTPSVTTSIGAEGMQGDLPWPGKVADSTEEIINASVQLYLNESAWLTASMQAEETVQIKFNAGQLQLQLQTRIEDYIENIGFYRSKHFYRSLLNHAGFNSYKYMSRWIELKNKFYSGASNQTQN